MNVDGKKLAEELLMQLAEERKTLPPVLKLGVLMAGGNKATQSFVRIKERAADRLSVAVLKDELPEGATTKDALTALERLSHNCHGVIVQIPLSPSINTEEVLSAIPKEKDIDGINPTIEDSDRLVNAPVAEAVREILMRFTVEVVDKRAIVIGAGRLVGKPAAHLLISLGAQVTTLTSEDSLASLSDADIIISGAGTPHLITPEMLKVGVVLIDAGTSEAEGKIVGDADPTCAQKCSIFTPVPGGVGPLAVAMIFKNLFKLAA